jgi:putative ABC transport system permease protein
MISDFKFALRMLVKRPGFACVAILTLALGIGANSAIFSVVEGTLLRGLPFPRPEQLVRLYEAQDESGARSGTLNMSEQTVQQWREFGRDIFQEVGAATGANVVVGGFNGEPARNVQAARVSANFFSVLGLQPARGRNFTVEEDRSVGPPVAIISDDFWRDNLNARSDIVGSTLMLDGVPHTIVGVMPKAFRHPYRSLIWIPLALSGPPNRLNHYLYAPARLRPGITIAQAEAAVRQMCAAINQADPNPNNARRAYIPPLRESFILDLRPKILVIVGAAFCALLIAAANFAGLLLARVIEREGEFALRAALGASRRALVRQQLTQALLLAILGTLAGLLIASWATPTLFAMSPEGSDATGSAMREFDHAVRMDWPVFGFAAGMLMFVGLGFGILPALRASRVDLRGAISATARGATLDRSARRLLGSLVVIELAVAAALLMASITATQYFRKLIEEPWGFETADRILFNVAESDSLFADIAAKRQSIESALAQLRAIPGVKDATMNPPRDLVSCVPEGNTPPEPRGYHLAYLRAAIPGYFKSTGPALLRGREFLETDTGDSPQVCIISEAFAKRFWPGHDPTGKRVKWGRLDGPRPWLTVVGVVGDMKAIADPQDGEVVGMVARPLMQLLATSSYQLDELTFIVRSNGPLPNESSIRAALARADSRLAAYQIVSLAQAAVDSRSTERFIFVLVSLFGALGLILAAVGLYGLLSLQVARREREFGIRAALGATARQIIELVLRQGVTLLSFGFAAGAVVTWMVVRLVQSSWAGMPAPNFLAWFGAALVLGTAVVIACWLPARRASRIDPVIALRAE